MVPNLWTGGLDVIFRSSNRLWQSDGFIMNLIWLFYRARGMDAGAEAGMTVQVPKVVRNRSSVDGSCFARHTVRPCT